MPGEKGPYRSVYSVIWDDPEFQGFDPVTQNVFFCLRTSKDCNFPCIFPHYHSTLYERMPKAPRKGIDAGMHTLINAEWVRYERPVLWIVKGLRNEPNYVPGNSKQIQGIVNILQSLPKMKIVEEFAAYYGIPFKYDAPLDARINEGIAGAPKQGTGTGTGSGTGEGEGKSVVPRAKFARFTPPALEEVVEYCRARGNNVDPVKFHAHYTSIGWMRGKNPIANWKACVVTWERNEFPHARRA